MALGKSAAAFVSFCSNPLPFNSPPPDIVFASRGVGIYLRPLPCPTGKSSFTRFWHRCSSISRSPWSLPCGLRSIPGGREGAPGPRPAYGHHHVPAAGRASPGSNPPARHRRSHPLPAPGYRLRRPHAFLREAARAPRLPVRCQYGRRQPIARHRQSPAAEPGRTQTESHRVLRSSRLDGQRREPAPAGGRASARPRQHTRADPLRDHPGLPLPHARPARTAHATRPPPPRTPSPSARPRRPRPHTPVAELARLNLSPSLRDRADVAPVAPAAPAPPAPAQPAPPAPPAPSTQRETQKTRIDGGITAPGAARRGRRGDPVWTLPSQAQQLIGSRWRLYLQEHPNVDVGDVTIHVKLNPSGKVARHPRPRQPFHGRPCRTLDKSHPRQRSSSRPRRPCSHAPGWKARDLIQFQCIRPNQ